jgi:hypothetical protein
MYPLGVACMELLEKGATKKKRCFSLRFFFVVVVPFVRLAVFCSFPPMPEILVGVLPQTSLQTLLLFRRLLLLGSQVFTWLGTRG